MGQIAIKFGWFLSTQFFYVTKMNWTKWILFDYLLVYYRPQRGCSKVMFLHLSVILFGGVVVWETPPPQADTPPPPRRPLQRTLCILLEGIPVFNIFSHSVVGQYSTQCGFPDNQAVAYFDHYQCCFSHSLMLNDMNEKKIGCDVSKVNCLIKFSSKHAMQELNRLWIIAQSWSPKCRIHCCDLKVWFEGCNCSQATSNWDF